MFLANLSASLLQYCDEKKCSQRDLASQCDITRRFVNKVICRHSNPSILTLEKLCMGTGKTPNELLFASADEALNYRIPMEVREIYTALEYRSSEYPVCPRCHLTLNREFQRYCDRCGQALSWNLFE